MPYDIRVVPGRDFLRLDANGRVNLDQSRQILSDIARECAASGTTRILLDTRQAESTMTEKDLYLLASAFGELGFQYHHRLAILHRPMNFDRAEFFAMCARTRGWQVDAFGSFEDAFNWLNEA